MNRRVAKVLIFYVDDSKSLLLILKRSMQAKECPGMGDLPGGKIDPEETFEAGIVREAFEETGLVLKKVFHIAHYTWQDSEGNVVEEHLFYAVVSTQDVVINSREHESFMWLSLDELSQGKLHPNLEKIILSERRKIESLLQHLCND